jgi:hypothetical protein
MTVNGARSIAATRARAAPVFVVPSESWTGDIQGSQ